MDELSRMEQLCTAMYNASNEEERVSAHNVLLPLVTNPQNIPQLQAILANSTNPCALLFAGTGLHKLITTNWSSIRDPQKDEMRNFLLNYLFNKGPDLMQEAPVALTPFIRLLCRIVKLQWLEGPQYHNICEHVSKFLSATASHWALGIEIYGELTADMQPQISTSMSRLRRAALSFRDSALPQIFDVALQTFKQFHSNTIQTSQENMKLLSKVLQLCVNCLSFDFMGAIPDETSDDQGVIMVPNNWTMLRDETLPQVFFDMYHRLWNANMPECCVQVLQALVLMSAVRRSFYQQENQRSRMMSSLMQGTNSIILNSTGLSNPNTYHEMCRLIGKINTAHSLSELTTSESFPEWIQHLYKFTIDGLNNWAHMANSKHYLLAFWSQMVNPLTNLRDAQLKTTLEEYTFRITVAYIDSRLMMAEACAQPDNTLDFDDPLSDDVMRTEQLEVLWNLGRCRYSDVAKHLITLFQGSLTQHGCIDFNMQSSVIFVKKMTWMVYMIGSIVGGHAAGRGQSPPSCRTDDGRSHIPAHVINGELATLVITLMNETDLQAHVPEALELGYLYFLEQFRKVYIGEHAKQMVMQQVNERLATVLGLEDENAILGLVIQKIGKNLQQRASQDQVIKRTLSLFYDLSVAINIVHTTDRSPHLIVTGRLLLKNETVKLIMANHASPQFAFLDVPKYGKYRTTYYNTLGRLFFMDVRDGELDTFLKPQETVLRGLCQSAHMLREEKYKLPIISLLRDLRGICLSCTSSDSYSMFFDWMVDTPKTPANAKVALLSLIAEAWWDCSEVTTPLLKFVSEFVYNKAQRISFPQSSTSGIILFREASKLLVTFGRSVLQRQQFNDEYREKYKGIAVALEMVSHALQGNYTNFGVFELYGDQALADSLHLALRMCLAIPCADLLAYIKAMKPYYLFLDLMTRSHLSLALERLDSHSIATLMRNVEEGILHFESAISMQCCGTIDNVVTYLWENKDKDDQNGMKIRQFLAEQPQCLSKVLTLMLTLILTGDFQNTWSMSRPLLGLILLHENEFIQIKERFVAQQLAERKIKFTTLFDELMSGVEGNLSARNKDTFTKKLYHFSQAIRQL
eukprot:GHVL01045004.1.p1 GENE.GHVL01045004.1~~GHVL01045004.1.p1  ORF type:complete len:1087 (+),score=125.34 GHVL01045004.1:37-3297(+)